jgi:tetratricopeptide (TPR) repeat protein
MFDVSHFLGLTMARIQIISKDTSTMTMTKMSSRPIRRRITSRWNLAGGKALLALLCILCLSGSVLAADDKQVQVKLDAKITKQATQYAHDLLQKMGSTNPKLISAIKAGETDSLYYIAKHMVEHGSDPPPAAAFSILHTLADGSSSSSRSPHVKSQVVLATAYYNKGDKVKAIHYFQLAGEQGPHQAALYNAGRTHAELENWAPAIAYIRESAVLGETHPEAVDEALTKTVIKAYVTFSEKIANAVLSIEQAADIFMYGALQDKLSEDDDENWKVAVTNLASFNETVTGIEPDYTALFTAFQNLRQLWEASSDKMSPLQAHILLKLTNDVLGYLTTLDDDFCLAAAGYAEALALSNYCYEQVTTLTKSTGDCFNVAVSRAASYYRRAKDLEGANRVRQLAGRHGTAATEWKQSSKISPLDQSPAIYHPTLRAQPCWETKDFATVLDLQQTYATSKTIRKELKVVQALSEKSARQEIETNERGEIIQRRKMASGNTQVGFRNVALPHTRARTMRNPTSGESHLGGWAEFGPLFDGKIWDEAKCRLVPTLCKALQSNLMSLCSSDEGSSKKSRYCESNAIVTMARIQPGTRILPGSGLTNAQLTMHLNLQGCQSVELTVGGAIAKTTGNDGHVVVFDDSFEHSIYHGGNQDCYLVKAILAHPDLI